jgi:asparagine synthetase B (glutamine-hydrolysing)
MIRRSCREDTTVANPGDRPAVVLVSGGLDSATTLALAAAVGLTPYDMTFLYGQRHAVEARAGRRVLFVVFDPTHQIPDDAAFCSVIWRDGVEVSIIR